MVKTSSTEDVATKTRALGGRDAGTVPVTVSLRERAKGLPPKITSQASGPCVLISAVGDRLRCVRKGTALEA